MRETRWRASEVLHHIYSLYVFFAVSLTLYFWRMLSRGRAQWNSLGWLWLQQLGMRGGEKKKRFPSPSLTFVVALTFAVLFLQRYRSNLLKQEDLSWACAAGETFSVHSASPPRLCEQALSICSAFIRQRKWIRNSFILLSHIYSFHRLRPLPTCVVISRWRAALHGPRFKPAATHNNSWDGTHTHIRVTLT